MIYFLEFLKRILTMKMNWMRDLIVNIHKDQFDNRIEFQFDQVDASAGLQEFIVEAMFAFCGVLIAIH